MLLYASTIALAGIDWQLTVALVPGPTDPALLPATAVSNRLGWYHSDVHMHALHSDGQRTPEELVDGTRAQELDFLISTKHNTNSANLNWGRYARPNLLVINGEEVEVV